MFDSTDSFVDIVHCQIHLLYIALRNRNGTLACISKKKKNKSREKNYTSPPIQQGSVANFLALLCDT